MTLHDYTNEIIDIIMKAANVEPIVKHKILKRVYANKNYKNFKSRSLVYKKQEGPRRKTARIVFHTLPPKIQELMLLACKLYELDIVEFCSNNRKDDTISAQRNVMFYLHRVLGYSSTKVGMYFMKDHSTILNACQVHNDRLEVERMYYSIYKTFREEANKIIFEASPQPKP